jgi:hypothetical protein
MENCRDYWLFSCGKPKVKSNYNSFTAIFIMDKRKKYRLAAIFVIISVIIVLIANYGLRISEDNLTELIVAVIITSSSFYGIIVSNKTNKQIDNINFKIVKINSNVEIIEGNIFELSKKHKELTGTVHNLSEPIKHKEQISSLGNKIESETADILENHYEISGYLKNLIILINESISLIIQNQYEY